MRKSILFVPVAAAAVLLALTACEPVQEGKVTNDKPSKTTSSDESPAAQDEDDAPAADDFQAAMGSGTVTYPDGFKVKVSAPKIKTVHEPFGDDFKVVTFDVTLTNGTQERVDSTLSGIDVAVGKNGRVADLEWMLGGDDDYGMGLSDFKELAPGRSATVTYAVKVKTNERGQTMDVSVRPGFLDGYEDALFTGKIPA